MDHEKAEALAARAKLTPKESAIFKRLALSPEEVVPRDVLHREIPGASARTLDTYIKNIRRKLSDAGFKDGQINTQIGKGFLFKPQPRETALSDV